MPIFMFVPTVGALWLNFRINSAKQAYLKSQQQQLQIPFWAKEKETV